MGAHYRLKLMVYHDPPPDHTLCVTCQLSQPKILRQDPAIRGKILGKPSPLTSTRICLDTKFMSNTPMEVRKEHTACGGQILLLTSTKNNELTNFYQPYLDNQFINCVFCFVFVGIGYIRALKRLFPRDELEFIEL